MWPRINIQSGTLEALKWLAMVCMTIDHANRFFAQPNLAWAYHIGRLAMPLFAFVFAYNLAQINGHQHYIKSAKRLFFYGLLATPAYAMMMSIHGIVPLNIMFTLLMVVVILSCNTSQYLKIVGIGIFVIAGLWVDYSWPGILLCLAFWLYCHKPSLGAFVLICIGYFFVNLLINHNDWSLLTLPVIIMSSQFSLPLKRIQRLFWIYYPLHLNIFAGIKLLYLK